MTVATDERIYLSESLQKLIDSRLETIERMLLGRVARAERIAIVREVESQIHELLGERETDELSREDVLSVLARLDPPEAYLGEDAPTDLPSPQTRSPVRTAVRSVHHEKFRVARASTILGLLALSSAFVLLPLGYVIASLFGSDGSEVVAIFLCGGALLIMLVSGVLGIVLGISARKSGAWALAGIVTSMLAVLLELFMCAALVLQLV
jgi:hypothetical protein